MMSADSFVELCRANVQNGSISNQAFRDMLLATLRVVETRESKKQPMEPIIPQPTTPYISTSQAEPTPVSPVAKPLKGVEPLV